MDSECASCGEIAFVFCPHRGIQEKITPRQSYCDMPPAILLPSTRESFGGTFCVWYPRERGIKGYLDPLADEVHIGGNYSLGDVLKIVGACRKVCWISAAPSTTHVLESSLGFLRPEGIGARVRRYK